MKINGKSAAEKRFDLIAKYWLPTTIVFLLALLLGFWSYGRLPPADIGQVGDFFGGLLNPFLTFLTVLLLIYSINFQVDELKETRKEIKASAESQKSTAESQEYLVRQGRTSQLLDSNLKSVERIFKELDEINSFKARQYNQRLKIYLPNNNGDYLTFGELLSSSYTEHTLRNVPIYRVDESDLLTQRVIDDYVYLTEHLVFSAKNFVVIGSWHILSSLIKRMKLNLSMIHMLYLNDIVSSGRIADIHKALVDLEYSLDEIFQDIMAVKNWEGDLDNLQLSSLMQELSAVVELYKNRSRD